MFKGMAQWLGLIAALCFVAQVRSQQPSTVSNDTNLTSVTDSLLTETNRDLSWNDPRRFSYQAGVAFITGSTIDDILTGDSTLARGDAAGEIYLIQVSYQLKRLDPVWFGHRLEADLQLPAVLGVVNERGSDPFLQPSFGFTIRWRTFPWNKWLYTNVETGVGLTYSQHVLATEHVQHPDRDRSHLEFYWPIQVMLAHPHYRQHQLVLLLHHHSGGGIFHTGGANSVGFGYRYSPRDKN
jgi:hypothetical protein